MKTKSLSLLGFCVVVWCPVVFAQSETAPGNFRGRTAITWAKPRGLSLLGIVHTHIGLIPARLSRTDRTQGVKAPDALSVVIGRGGDEQNLAASDLLVVIIIARTNRLSDLLPLVPEVLNALASMRGSLSLRSLFNSDSALSCIACSFVQAW